MLPLVDWHTELPHELAESIWSSVASRWNKCLKIVRGILSISSKETFNWLEENWPIGCKSTTGQWTVQPKENCVALTGNCTQESVPFNYMYWKNKRDHLNIKTFFSRIWYNCDTILSLFNNMYWEKQEEPSQYKDLLFKNIYFHF